MQKLRAVNFNFPLYDSKQDGLTRLKKVHEELAEVAWEAADPKKVNIQKLLLEAQDVVQASISLAYHALTETMEHDKAVVILDLMLESLNEAHCNKIQTYAEERGWQRV